VTLLAIGFALIFLLGLQQQHIAHENHGWSVLTSYAIAAAQVMFVQESVVTDALGAFWLGTGGALGASASIVVHKRFIRRKAARGSGD